MGRNGMKQTERSRICLGEQILAQVQPVGNGVRILICGGSRPHIGAVSIAGPDGEIRTQEFPGHRDGAVSEEWVKAFSTAGFLPAVAEAGIHYDGLDGAGIAAVLETCREMLKEILAFALAPEET